MHPPRMGLFAPRLVAFLPVGMVFAACAESPADEAETELVTPGPASSSSASVSNDGASSTTPPALPNTADTQGTPQMPLDSDVPEPSTAPANSPAAEPESTPPAPTVANPEPAPETEPEPASTVDPEPVAASPVDCSAIEAQGWQLCDSGSDFCAAVFTDGAGCAAVCAAVGLSCAEVWEDADGCTADTSRAPLSCGESSGHESDYCLCSGPGGAVVQPEPAAEPSAEPEAPSEPEVPSEPAASEPEPEVPEPEAMEPEPVEPDPAQPDIGPRACECETPAGEFGTVNDTIVVGPGQTYDGECQIFRANSSTLGDGSQDEGQQPVFRVENGATLRNIVLGASAADGVHLYGDVTLENIHWLDIGEDAMTVKESGTVNLDCGSATNGEDKVFQVNAASELHISNFTASNASKFIRQNGDTTFEIRVFIDHSDISSMGEVIFRTDSSTSHVTLTNSRYSDLGDGLFMFGDAVVDGNSDQSSVSNNEEY